MITLLVNLLVLALIAYVAFWVIGQIGLPQPAALVARAIIGIIVLLLPFGMFGIGGGEYSLYRLR